MKFINRYDELQLLEDEYNKKDSTFSVIYGRRRTGKTTLIREFIKNKPSLYFFADTQNEVIQISRFQNQIADVFQDKFVRNITFNNWDSIFDYFISKIDDNKKIVFVIDEFQYLIKSNRNFASIFQRIYDTKLKNKDIMIIICGSIISMMYSEVLSYNSPLYGRRTSQINLKQIYFRHYHEFFENLSKEKLIEFYSITGGIPKYIELLDENIDLFENISKEILDKNKFLYAEPRFLLQEEVNEVSTYFSILEIIASGEHKLSDITARLGVTSSSITSFLKKLIDLDKIEKRVPITENNPEKSKKGLYFIKDNYLRFWFKYVFPYQSYLEINKKEFLLDKLKISFSSFVAEVFEDISQEILMNNQNIFEIQKIGRWWDKNNEIDLIAIGKKEILYGECKWSKNHVGISVLNDLISKSKDVPKEKSIKEEYFALFSKSGFSDELIDLSKKNSKILLFDLKYF